jgi:hypothetical protein
VPCVVPVGDASLSDVNRRSVFIYQSLYKNLGRNVCFWGGGRGYDQGSGINF